MKAPAMLEALEDATTKAFALRMTDFGYRILILGDPKDEYERLCHFFGVAPFALGPGLPARINPLAFGPLAGRGRAERAAPEHHRARFPAHRGR